MFTIGMAMGGCATWASLPTTPEGVTVGNPEVRIADLAGLWEYEENHLVYTLPLDGNFPFLHLDRKFMHLGFHIYDVGFQSPNVEAARPLVYATALLLVLVIVVLNLAAITIRNHLREQYKAFDH